MNEDIIAQLLDESIQLELNVARLYEIFHTTFTTDADIWWTLSLEEKNHAALLRSGKESFLPGGLFPAGLVSKSLTEIKSSNMKLTSLIHKYENSPPSREEAFNIAIEIEHSAGEVHFQKFMEKEPTTKIEEIFHKLNGEDKDHANRIRTYMINHGIKSTLTWINHNQKGEYNKML